MINKLNKIFISVFGLDKNYQITEETCPDDIEKWDSLGHLDLLLSIESEFNIKIPLSSFKELITVKAIIDKIEELKTNA